MRYAPSLQYKKSMLRTIGAQDVFSDIPSSYLLDSSPLSNAPLSDIEIERKIEDILSTNKNSICFRGGGVYDHYVPAHISEIVSRNEFYTSYTPYQPEISQGMLQALYEYQSLMSELLGMPVVNASMYDWSSSLAEAALMCARVTGKERFIVPDTMSPLRLEILETYCGSVGITVVKMPHNKETGMIDFEKAISLIKSGVCGVYVEYPSYYGFFDNGIDRLSELAHDAQALFVMGVDPLACSIVKCPGEYDADIVVGEASHLGNPVNYGGPLLGIFAIKDERKYIRTMPGRIVGKTHDTANNSGYVLTLQTREQHIRREKATSNICTNESLCAIACGAYMASLGPHGLKELAKMLISNSRYAYESINDIEGFTSPVFDAFHFREFVVHSEKNISQIEKKLNDHAIIGGIHLDNHNSLFCITDKHSKNDIDLLCDVLRGD